MIASRLSVTIARWLGRPAGSLGRVALLLLLVGAVIGE
jgi:hypothetical protein